MRTQVEIDRCFAPRNELSRARRFFLVGIGGAGLSGVARMLRHRGHAVAGTDSTASPITKLLEDLGIEVFIGHTGDPVRDGDALILSDAIDLEESPEVQRARELGVPLFRRSQALGWLLQDRRVIAVTGTHGKTTTTGMIAAGLRTAGMDPLIVVGAEVPEFGSAVVEGEGEWAVIEACEAYNSFSDLDPDVAVITNLELDHVDFHKNWENLSRAAVDFAARVPENGLLIHFDQEGANEIAERAHVAAKKIRGDEFGGDMAQPGAHNRINASLALAACQAAGADPSRAIEGISRFGGAERRLQVLREGPITVVDDYAHHPTEIEASIEALRARYPERRMVVVYQPHLYSRTAAMLDGFADALSAADEVVLTDIYPAREAPMPGMSSLRIAEKMAKPPRYVPSRHLLPRIVAQMAQPGDLIVGMGAGHISDFAPAFIQELDRSSEPKVVVFYGGDSAEREVSLLSGREVYGAVKRLGYRAELRDATEALLAKGDLSWLTGAQRPDIALLAVHGTSAEDGAIQGLLNLAHIPFSGSSIQASALAMDKNLTKQILAQDGIDTPKGQLVSSADEEVALPLPLVVKPNAQGSTVGLSFVTEPDRLRPAIKLALLYGREALVEEMVKGTEISVPVMGDRALPAVEIVPASGRYDFESKYTPGATDEICPARLSAEITERVKALALQAHRAMRCSGITRTDMIITGDRIVVLEVNTVPGMTRTSLVPRSAEAAGINFDDLVLWMVKDAEAKAAADKA